MTRATHKLLEDALALPDEERELLLIELQASLAPDAAWEAAWSEECTRRLADCDAGRVLTQSWEEAQLEVHRAIAAARKK